MESVWSSPTLANEIIKNDDIFNQIQSVVTGTYDVILALKYDLDIIACCLLFIPQLNLTDIVSGRVLLTSVVENMSGVLTHQEAENREKGMKFYTKLLKNLPVDYLTDVELKFISKFYVDRLKDHHRVIPHVLEGYLSIIEMKNYNVKNSAEFFNALFREVACQSQLRQDRFTIYSIIQKVMDIDAEYVKSLGPDFIYGFISAMDGERDPRNLLFLFAFLPKFMVNVPLGHLTEEMFDVISCYYPVDFHPSNEDPAAVTRQDLADALMPCLCAVPEFGEQCLSLLIEKLESNLRLAKIDSLKLLKETCKTFNSESYGSFLKSLWSSIHREISHKTDDELKLAAHEALSALVSKLATSANTDQGFEIFVKGILISMQTAITEATTVAQFVQAAKVLLTTANASKESCLLVTKSMIPAIITYYGLKSSPKLQMASLDFLGDLYDMAKHWNVLDSMTKQVEEIPQLCLTAVSQPMKEYQIAGFKTLIRVKSVLNSDLVLPFVEVLMHNIQHSQDNDLLSVSVEAVHAIGRKYPELIMNTVIRGKCDLENITQDKSALQKRLNLLTNLASIDDFTKVIIQEMLKIVLSNDEDASKVIEALNESLSNTNVYTDQKVSEIESDHGLIESILTWLFKELHTNTEESLSNGFTLVANTISSLISEKQETILTKHTGKLLEKCKLDETYYKIIYSLYSSIHQCVYNCYFEEILLLSLRLSLTSEHSTIRLKACILTAHFLNKAEYGQKFELLYESLKNYLTTCSRDDQTICPRLILLYGWITKALIMRGSDLFFFWLQKITVALSSSEYCKQGSEAIHVIMTDYPDYLSVKNHCRSSILYHQRMFQSFTKLTEKFYDNIDPNTRESYLLSWAYVLGKAPKSVLNNQVDKITPLLVDALDVDNTELLLVMIDVLAHFVQAKHFLVAQSLQTIMPRLISLTKYVKSMDVRIKSLQCLYDIANTYATVWLLPLKQDTLLELAPALDDRKRLVRGAAVRARTRWFLVGAPGEAKAD